MSDQSPAHLEAFQEQRFSSFLEAAPDAVVIIDQGGRIVQVNGQTEIIFGHGREELLGQRKSKSSCQNAIEAVTGDSAALS